MEWFQMPENQVLEKVNSREQGISSEEAERRLKENGRNVLWERKPKKWFQVFIEQFQDLLVWILLAAAVVSALTDNGESAVVIGAVLTLNAALGTTRGQSAAGWSEGDDSCPGGGTGRHYLAGNRGFGSGGWAAAGKQLSGNG